MCSAPGDVRFVPIADIRAKGHATFLTGGIFQDPLRIEGLFSFGQYIRNIRINLPSGAGSQFDSLSVPGESSWMYRLSRPGSF